MKILHITDSHGTVKNPSGRTDVYYIAFLRKMVELGYVIKQYGIDMVIHTGDLFHTPRVSDKFAGQLSEIMKSWGVPIYVVPGNHDIDGYTIDTVDQTKLGLLAKAGVVQLLTRDTPLMITDYRKSDHKPYTIAISGQEYYADIDTGNADDFAMQCVTGDFNILAIHGYIADVPQHPSIKHTLAKDVVTDADVILSGHYHQRFEYDDGNNTIFNPGSMLRTEQNQYNKTHMPCYGILEVELSDAGLCEFGYDFYNFRCAQPADVIFDYNAKYQQQQFKLSLDNFKQSLMNASGSLSTANYSIQSICDKIIERIVNYDPSQEPITSLSPDKYSEYKGLKECTNKLCTEGFKSIDDVFKRRHGYLESTTFPKVQIKKVIIDGFQSHDHTEINFSDKMNVITGETNNGKTSIFRAIMWVVSNRPLGTDFIMSGKDKCYVRIEYDTGEYIERCRSVKSGGSGYYETSIFTGTKPDEHGTEQRVYLQNNFQGFANEVPLTVENIHQMPKVYITQDISTYLNVVSQLDPPFLLTESPTTKAAAIGRISGTHIIDSAVRLGNKEISDLNKEIKFRNQGIAEWQGKMGYLPDIERMDYVRNTLEDILHYVCNQRKDIGALNYNYIVYNGVMNDINTQTSELDKQKDILAMKPVVELYEKHIGFAESLDSSYHKYKDTLNDIVSHEKAKEESELWIKAKPTISSISDIIECVSFLNDKYSGYINTGNIITQFQEQSESVALFAVSGTVIVKYCEKLISDISNINTLLVRIKDTDELIQSLTLKKEELRKDIEQCELDMFDINSQCTDIIINNHVCPCCGQPLKEIEHAANVTEFMVNNR